MPREIDIVPFANNDLPSDFLYSQREYYVSSSDVYPQLDDNQNTLSKPIDIWYEKATWGKTDTKGRFVFADPSYIISVGNGLGVMNFVAEAYINFRDFALQAAGKLRTSMTSLIDIENPVKGSEDVTLGYKNYFENVIDNGFVNIFLTDFDKSTIKNFIDYSNKYMLFVEVNKEIPHTLAGYISSPLVSNRCTGLIMEFAEDRYDEDSIKWEKYLSNDFFDEYIKIAASFGFYVNKHIPWAIAANMNSNRMKNYMNRYGFKTANQFFNTYCYQAEYISYISFKKYMFFSYASFLSYRPRMEVIKYKNCIKTNIRDSSFKTEREVMLRPAEIAYFDPSYSQFTSVYSDFTFIKLYVTIRLIEENVKLTKQDFNKLVYDMIYAIKKNDVFAGMLHFSDFLASRRYKPYSTLTKKTKSARMSPENGFSPSSYFSSGDSMSTEGTGGGGSTATGY